MTKICFFVVPRKAALYIELTFFDNMAHPSGTLFVPIPLQISKALILKHAVRVGNNRHRVFVLLCTRCLKPCPRGVRLQPLAQPASKRKEAQGENALCLHAEVSVSDKCRECLEKRVRHDKICFLQCLCEAKSLYRISVFLISNLRDFRYKVWRFYGSVIFDVKRGGFQEMPPALESFDRFCPKRIRQFLNDK